MCNCKCECYSEKNMIKNYLEEYRKQRSGEIDGTEYNDLERVFNYLKKKISKTEYDYCRATFREIGTRLFGKDNPRQHYIAMTLRQLEFLGNISLEGQVRGRKYRILKPLEF